MIMGTTFKNNNPKYAFISKNYIKNKQFCYVKSKNIISTLKLNKIRYLIIFIIFYLKPL